MTPKKNLRERLPEHITLSGSAIHLWKIRINDPPIGPEELYESILSGDERARADRLRFAEEREKLIISRGVLRSILSKYLKSGPGDIVFEYNEYGKPGLPTGVNPDNIKFNLSHSRNLIVYAVAKDMEVGIDIEYIRDVKSAQKIIDRFFSPSEREYYRTRPDALKAQAFFKLWTGKEAYTKARGTGFSLPVNENDISLIPGDTPPSRDKNPGALSHEDFSLYEIETDNNYIAALVVQGRDHELIYF